MELKVPESLRKEHGELHEELARATRERGGVGRAARAVAEVLHPHFLKEEKYAMPPLALLPALAEGRTGVDVRDAIVLTEKLKTNLGQMLEEHRAIVAALKGLTRAARRAKKPKHMKFAEKLRMHAQNEEEVLYPASILVGEYLKVRL